MFVRIIWGVFSKQTPSPDPDSLAVAWTLGSWTLKPDQQGSSYLRPEKKHPRAGDVRKHHDCTPGRCSIKEPPGDFIMGGLWTHLEMLARRKH